MADDPPPLDPDLAAELERQADTLKGLPPTADALVQFEWLVNTLIFRKQIPESFRRLIARMRGTDMGRASPTVRLHVFHDKYEAIEPEIDCAAHLHLCQARCCSFQIPLSKQDVSEGKLPWVIEHPYMMPKDREHKRCTLITGTGGCTAYEVRPSVCRTYDCRLDKRVWLDYEHRVPAPMVDIEGNPIPDLPGEPPAPLQKLATSDRPE